ncbi:MAG TPA: outer membrane beta-barrel protein [Gemmatimonadaceae bacterium]|nr:outer membrane beta-barrel protein [Gemmatimonadaceae bacterium]
MRGSLSRAAFVALAMASLGAAAAAQEMPIPSPMSQQPKRYILSLGVSGGMAVPTGNGSTNVKSGFGGRGFLLLQLPGGLPALRFDLGYQRFDLKNALLGAAGADPLGATGTNQVLSGVGGLTINLLHGPVRPYLTAGIGGFQVKTNIDSSSLGGPTSKSQFNFGVDGGVGLALNFGRVGMFTEGRVQNVYTKNGGFIKSAKSIQSVLVSAGLTVGLF